VSSEEERMIRVRMPSGKIYGPYTRSEIKTYISKSRLRGEEEIFISGELAWRPLSSEPGFFDAIQEAQFHQGGERTHFSPQKVKKVEKDSFGGTEKKDLKTKRIDLNESETAVVSLPRDEKSENKLLVVSSLEKISQEKKDVALLDPSSEKKEIVRNEKKKFKLFFPFLAFTCLCFSLYFFNKPGLQKANNSESRGFPVSKLSEDHRYFNPLRKDVNNLYQIMKSQKKLSKMNILNSSEWNPPPNFSLNYFIKKIDSLNSQKEHSDLRYWKEFAWSYLWASGIISGHEKNLSQEFKKISTMILEEIKVQDGFSESDEVLFRAAQLFLDGSLSRALVEFSALKSDFALWMQDEIKWLLFWGEGEKSKVPELVKRNYSSDYFKKTSDLRYFVFKERENIIFGTKNLLNVDSSDYHSWFALAQYFWRMNKNKSSLSRRYFLTGLSAISSFPLPVQLVYVQQWKEFESLFGRELTAEKLTQNLQFLKKVMLGEVFDASDWNPVDRLELGFEFSGLIKKIQLKIESSDMNVIDLSALETLGTAQGSSLKDLESVLLYNIFNQKWKKVEELSYESLQESGSDSGFAHGVRSWLFAEMHLFGKSFEELESMNSSSDNAEKLKFSGIVHVVAKDFEKGRADLESYISNKSNDALAYYFLAKSYYDEKEYVSCVEKASGAKRLAQGVIKFQSTLLFYRCRILGGIGVQKALTELDQWRTEVRENVAATVEYVHALIVLEENAAAEIAIQKAFVEHKNSYQLNLLMGDLLSKKSKKDQAMLLYNRARKLDPKNLGAIVRIGNLLFEEERYDEAAQKYRHAARLDPSYPGIFSYVAKALEKGSNKSEAIEYYKKELKQRPLVVAPFLGAARIALEQSMPGVVPELFREFGKSFENNPRVILRLAQSYAGTGRCKEAQKYALLLSSRLMPQEPESYRILGNCYYKDNHFKLAQSNYLKYIQLSPNAPYAQQIRKKLRNPVFGQSRTP